MDGGNGMGNMMGGSYGGMMIIPEEGM